jgi:hypothetical protein
MFQEELKLHIAQFTTSPFLFIGSGFSRRYINIPTWEYLLVEMCNRLKLARPYEYYKSNANSDLPEVANLMGLDFNDTWWSSPLFEESRNYFQKEAKTKLSPLKYEICKRIDENTILINDSILENELRLLRKINIDGIITTNWDNLVEKIFPDFKKYIGQEELIFSDLYTIGEIYKIHGCTSSPNSLVLTTDDYENFQDRNSYLAAKLLTIFIENPIIFIGYSLDDKNIQNILKSIIKCLTKNNVEKLKERLIFCQWSDLPITPSITDSTMLISETIIPIKLIKLHNYIDLYTVLANNKKKLPTKVLRQMKGMVYDFVKTNNSKQKVFVTDNLENIEDIHKAEFVWGVGLRDKLAEQGVKGIELKDILKDIILNDNSKWDSSTVAKLALPMMAINSTYVPYFKYLRKANLLNSEGKINEDTEILEFTPSFINKVNSVKVKNFYPAKCYAKKEIEINETYASFSELKNNCKDNNLHIMMYTPLLSSNKIDPEDLRLYIEENINLIEDSRYGTHFRKLICLYDYLKYKNT